VRTVKGALAAVLLTLTGCGGAVAPPAPSAATVVFIFSPPGEGQGLELGQAKTALAGGAADDEVVSGQVTLDQDTDDVWVQTSIFGFRCPGEAAPPSPPPAPADPNPLRERQYQQELRAYRADLDRQAFTCARTQGGQLAVLAQRLGPPGPEDVAGGPPSESWDIAPAIGQALVSFDSADATGAGPATRRRVLIVMANLAGTPPPSALPSLRDTRVAVVNFSGTPERAEAWRRALARAGAQAEVVDRSLTPSLLPQLTRRWVSGAA
jgi:hypothetical protein